ncbi:MAG TPA: hypothetical protein VGI39_22595 [Polyangiaceae bacterium]|jgi:hypothetical protein
MATVRGSGATRDETPAGARLEAVVALTKPPEALGPVTKVRSTLITTSLRTLTERQLAERYFIELAPEHRSTVQNMVAGAWVPVEVAIAHYTACDALDLSSAVQLEIGQQVGSRIQGTLLGTMANLSKQAGATPWTFLSRLDRLYDRLAIGGGVSVDKRAPKEALVNMYGVPLFDIPYFATAWRGVIQGLCELFCGKAYAKHGQLSTKQRITYIVAWA